MLKQAFVLALNHLLRADAGARDRLRAFSGRTARLAIPPVAVVITVNEDGTVSEAAAAEVDVDLRLPTHAPLRVLAGKDAALKDVQVSGSVEFADALGALARDLRWDYEEDLSRLVGDVAAHRIGQGLRRLARWQSEATGNLAANLAEYYRDEARVIAGRAPIAEFNSAVDSLRDDVARLEKRIEQLKRRRPNAGR